MTGWEWLPAQAQAMPEFLELQGQVDWEQRQDVDSAESGCLVAEP